MPCALLAKDALMVGRISVLLVLASGRHVHPVARPRVGLTRRRFARLGIATVRARCACEVVIRIMVPVATACTKTKVMRHNRVRICPGIVSRSGIWIEARPHLRKAVRRHVLDRGLHQALGINRQVNLLRPAGASPIARCVPLRIACVERWGQGLYPPVTLRPGGWHWHGEAHTARLNRRTIPSLSRTA
jgi:hypothetical protein